MSLQSHFIIYFISAVAACVVVLGANHPDLPPEESSMWEKATQRYKQLHHSQQIPYESRDTDYERYMHIDNLHGRGWNLAKHRGVLFIGKARHRLPQSNAVYFSSLVLPTDELARPMRLRDKAALVLWKKVIGPP